MTRTFNRRWFCWVVVITVAICLAVASFGSPVVAAGAQVIPGISPTVQEQLAAIRAEKQSRTPVQRKIDSGLLYAVKNARGAAFPPHFPNLQSKVATDPQGKVTVDVRGRLTPGLLTDARRVGATLVSAVPQSHAVRLRVALSQVEDLAASPDLTFIAPASKPRLATGRVNSEGDTTHRANRARSAFRVDGTGAKIGVLSDGAASLAASQASGDLGPVTVLPGQAGSGDEGTAMLEIVHDLAPGAQLFFATGSGGEAILAQNIRNLRSAGANIIVDDVGYATESPFQDGLAAQAVNDVTARGALYFSAAGNDGNYDDGTSGTWEGDFVPSTTSGPLGLGVFADFDPTAAVQIFNPVPLMTSDPNDPNSGVQFARLYWADPYGGSANDYDLYLFDGTKKIIGVSNNYQTGTQDPYEGLDVPGSPNGGTAYLAIARFSGQARFMHLAMGKSGRLGYATTGAISDHSAAANAFGVAATPAARAGGPGAPVGPYPNPFTRSNVSEIFTSDGPRRMFYAADGTPYTPGNFTSSGGIVRQKPDITAADGVATTVTTVTGLNPFFGTSAAAPHAAAIAALLLTAHPGITPAQVRTRLTSTAIDIEKAGWDRDTGAGIIDAYAALRPPSG